MHEFETVVGLEVHVELKTRSKIFCSCPTAFGGDPNAHICEVCAGLPGALPRLNKKVVEYAVRTALALNCEITEKTRFDRKNYFYPDLPKGYQISQLYAPVGRNGSMKIDPSSEKVIRIHELHMEDDAGKLIHDGERNLTRIDFSRCGVPLLEIVTEPDFRTADEVTAFLTTLRTMLKAIGVSDCKMQEGSLRADVNLSVRPVGEKKLGTRTEMKNLSSFRAVSKAIEYESLRQWNVLSEGGEVHQETRRWDEEKEASFSMRKKEEAAEYKYFPEPDLPVIYLPDDVVEAFRKTLPELPASKFQRYVEEWKIPAYDAGILTSEKTLSDLFERTVEVCGDAKEASNWIMGELMKLLNENGILSEDLSIRGASLGEIICLIKDGRISRASGKEILKAALLENAIPEEYADEKGLWLITDRAELEEILKKVIEENPKAVGEYRDGKTKNFQFLLGQAMRATKGKADPGLLTEILRALLV